MKARLSEMAPGPVLCTETDLLFEPTLKLDPLRLMRDASKVIRLVVAWSGSYTEDVLAYAVPKHGHYRTWRNPGVSISVLE
ncbi:MAG: BREX-3 system P-loop-containing protein BrxF [Chloroflexi bacterium]|nr:BREX-3 system P-loop-containing protein BrxF [Chloroflexota bacterium]